MPLPDPQLDDRRFQDIVNEAKMLIPRYCPEWTDHNVSDPGVTMIELFAWMTDLILYRMNRVPEKNYLRFMDLIGMQLKDAVPATTDVTLRLSAPQPGPILIPRGTPGRRAIARRSPCFLNPTRTRAAALRRRRRRPRASSCVHPV